MALVKEKMQGIEQKFSGELSGTGVLVSVCEANVANMQTDYIVCPCGPSMGNELRETQIAVAKKFGEDVFIKGKEESARTNAGQRARCGYAVVIDLEKPIGNVKAVVLVNTTPDDRGVDSEVATESSIREATSGLINAITADAKARNLGKVTVGMPLIGAIGLGEDRGTGTSRFAQDMALSFQNIVYSAFDVLYSGHLIKNIEIAVYGPDVRSYVKGKLITGTKWFYDDLKKSLPA